MNEYEVQFTYEDEIYNVWCTAENEDEVKTRTSELYDENGKYVTTIVIGECNPYISKMKRRF